MTDIARRSVAVPPKSAAQRGLRTAMAPLHTWAGLLFGWLLFAVFLTGTVSYFRDEVSLWMKPEIPAAAAVSPEAAAVGAVRYLQETAADARRWMIDLPTERMPATSAIIMRDARHGAPIARMTLAPATGAPIAARATAGGDFLYYFHYDLYLPWRLGRYLVCTAAIAMLVAFISGVIVHRRIFKDFFTFRPRKGQRSWLDAHNALGVLALPFHVMITYTGLVTLLALYLPWGIDAMYPNGRQDYVAELFDDTLPRKPANIAGSLTPVEPLLAAAELRWEGGKTGRIVIDNPGDRAATIRLVRRDSDHISHAVQSMLFDGATGALLSVSAPIGPAAQARGIFHGLHLARFSDTGLRWLFFISGIVGSAMIATGVLLWAVKRRRHSAHFGHRLVDALNVTAIIGLPIAIAAFLLCNRLVPAGTSGRITWEIGGFFGAWLATGVHAALRPRHRAWIEQLVAASALFALLPLVNGFTTGRGVWRSLASGDWVFAGIDMTSIAAALLLAWSAIYLRRRETTESLSSDEWIPR